MRQRGGRCYGVAGEQERVAIHGRVQGRVRSGGLGISVDVAIRRAALADPRLEAYPVALASCHRARVHARLHPLCAVVLGDAVGAKDAARSPPHAIGSLHHETGQTTSSELPGSYEASQASTDDDHVHLQNRRRP